MLNYRNDCKKNESSRFSQGIFASLILEHSYSSTWQYNMYYVVMVPVFERALAEDCSIPPLGIHFTLGQCVVRLLGKVSGAGAKLV